MKKTLTFIAGVVLVGATIYFRFVTFAMPFWVDAIVGLVVGFVLLLIWYGGSRK